MRQLYDRKVTLKRLAFSPDGALLAAGGYTGVVQLWDAVTGQLRGRLVGLGASVEMVAFTADESLLATSSFCYLWEPRGRSGRIEGQACFPDAINVRAAALSADRQTLFAGYYSRETGYRFDALRFPGGERLWGAAAEYTALPVTFGFGPHGRTLYAAYHPGTVWACEAATGTERGEVARTANGLKSIAVSPDGRRLACAAGRQLHLLALDGRGEIARHKLGRTHFLAVAFHPSGDFFASANGDGKVDYWDGRTGQHRRAFDWKVGKLNDVVFDHAGDRAACCSKDGHVVVWDVDR